MITRDQFRLQMERLKDAFGDHKFPDQREVMLWESSEGHDYGVIIHVVDMFIRNSKTAPLPSEFAEAVGKAANSLGARKFALGEIQPSDKAKCWDCGDSGFVRLVRNETFAPWAKWSSGSAPCHCLRGRDLIAAGKRMRPSPVDFGPQFSDDWHSSYSINPSWESGRT